MDKSILYDYIDACALIKETEEDIRNHRKREVVNDKVKGSNPEFPYQPMSFPVSGMLETPISNDEEERLLQERKANARRIKVQAEKVINAAPMRMQRIIRFKIMKRLSWNEVSARMNEDKSGDAYRMEFERYMKEK